MLLLLPPLSRMPSQVDVALLLRANDLDSTQFDVFNYDLDSP